MRKSQREIKDFDTVIRVLDNCQTLRLGLYDDEFPYVVPLSFGWEVINGELSVYFHCAKEGKKVDLIAASNAVTIEADTFNGYVKTEQGITADYESVIGFGFAERIFGETAKHGLKLLLAHCGIDGYSAESCMLNEIVAVYKIAIKEITGKKRF